MRSLENRFWSKVEKSDSCWKWKASKSDGYGQIGINGKNVRAHRVAWNLVNGDIPKDMCVLHSCDNPACVNPDHLFLGSQKDNMHDMINKGRKPDRIYNRGEDCHLSKLKRKQVNKIRLLHSGYNWNAPKIAKKFNVTKQTIYSILKGETWNAETG